MSYKIVLQPGELNDANRDYLPKAIKGSRMVVNENGNNSQVYPARLTEYVEDILGDGIRDVWYEYVPESYDSGKKTPLVFSMHGGLMTGWGQCIYTSWSLVAEKEGFLCVFPNASANKMWMIECRLPFVGKAVLMVALIYLVIQMKSSEIQPFIYFQF